MPVIHSSDYKPTWILRHSHSNTIISAVLRIVPQVPYQRERLELPDGDFIDTDWLKSPKHDRLLIILHGMEGSSRRPYVKGMAKAFHAEGHDVVVMHFRGCSGTPNRLPRAYHMGDTADLHFLIQGIVAEKRYSAIALAGFSLGGNVILKYLGEQGNSIPGVLQSAVVFSVPCDIPSAEQKIARTENRLYVLRFLHTLNAKMLEKSVRFPELVQTNRPMPRTLREFDERYTAPLHGFADAADYWRHSSSLPYLSSIRLPTLMVNALDDSFLSPVCFPFAEAKKSNFVVLETPNWGGHAGFAIFGFKQPYWSEQRALKFILNGR